MNYILTSRAFYSEIFIIVYHFKFLQLNRKIIDIQIMFNIAHF